MMGSLKKIWAKWLVISEIIGDIVSIIVLTIAYMTIFLLPCLFFTFISDQMGKKKPLWRIVFPKDRGEPMG